MAQQNRESATSLLLYRLLKWSVVHPLFLSYFHGKIYKAESVPLSGPLVVVSNHASNFDPPILSSCVGRPVAFMAKEELFKIPILKQAIELYGAYPVNRKATYTSAIRNAVSYLKQGWAVGIFLEGTRTPDAKIHQPKLGAATIAALAKAPLLPVCLSGTEKIFSPSSILPQPVPIAVRIGKLIEEPSSTNRQELQKITKKCAAAINAMHSLAS